MTQIAELLGGSFNSRVVLENTGCFDSEDIIWRKPAFAWEKCKPREIRHPAQGQTTHTVRAKAPFEVHLQTQRTCLLL